MSIRPMDAQPDLDAQVVSRQRPAEPSGSGRGAMAELLRANIRSHARRYVATGLAVAISVAFVVIALGLGSGMTNATTAVVRDQYAGAGSVITLDWNKVTWDDDDSYSPTLGSVVDAVEGTDGVSAVGQSSYGWLELAAGSRANTSISIANPEPFSHPEMTEGSMPTTSTDIAIASSVASQLDVSVGDTITVKSMSSSSSTDRDMTITGLYKQGTITSWGSFITPEAAAALLPNYDPDTLLVAGATGSLSDADQDALTDAVKTTLAGQAVTIKPAYEVINTNLEQLNMGRGTTTAMLLIFPLIAVAVAAIVVSTTFQIVLQQRRREIALLRTLGASAKQVRNLIRREALIVGAVASFIGVVVGMCAGAVVLKAVGLADGIAAGFAAQSPVTLILVWVLGTVVTFLIGMRPASGVARISPIEALAPMDEFGKNARKSHRVRLAFGIVLTALGVAGIVMGLRMTDLNQGFLLAFLSGLICLIGALLITSIVLPTLTFALGAPFRGVVAKIAKANTLRNPDRTASTGTAIVIGVTLITMMLVAAGSMRETLLTEVDDHRPFDMAVSGEAGSLTPDTLSRIGDVTGVAATAKIYGGSAVVDSSGSVVFTDAASTDEPQLTVLGEPDLNSVAHSAVSVLGDDDVRVNPDSIGAYGIDPSAGSLALCSAQNDCRTLTIISDDSVASGSIEVSAETLSELDPSEAVSSVYVKLADDADATQVQNDLLSIDNSFSVTGAAAERAMYTKIINTVLAVVVGLLGVSVLVALVGVANTLSLSVVERTRENGLLRALGFTKKQMQRMLAAESLFIALSGALIGLGLGIAFGCVGVLALPVEVQRTIIVIPWLQLLGVLAVAVVSALLASWWPGRKAARTSPVEALAAE